MTDGSLNVFCLHVTSLPACLSRQDERLVQESESQEAALRERADQVTASAAKVKAK